jgi:hypothetical protein
MVTFVWHPMVLRQRDALCGHRHKSILPDCGGDSCVSHSKRLLLCVLDALSCFRRPFRSGLLAATRPPWNCLYHMGLLGIFYSALIRLSSWRAVCVHGFGNRDGCVMFCSSLGYFAAQLLRETEPYQHVYSAWEPRSSSCTSLLVSWPGLWPTE